MFLNPISDELHKPDNYKNYDDKILNIIKINKILQNILYIVKFNITINKHISGSSDYTENNTKNNTKIMENTENNRKLNSIMNKLIQLHNQVKNDNPNNSDTTNNYILLDSIDKKIKITPSNEKQKNNIEPQNQDQDIFNDFYIRLKNNNNIDNYMKEILLLCAVLHLDKQKAIKLIIDTDDPSTNQLEYNEIIDIKKIYETADPIPKNIIQKIQNDF